jgi:hypothetical protein
MSLPNGNKIVTTIAGTISLSNSLILHNVYYIPDFNINLFSISQFLKTSNASFLFSIDMFYCADFEPESDWYS